MGTFSSLTAQVESPLQRDALVQPCTAPGIGGGEELVRRLPYYREMCLDGGGRSRAELAACGRSLPPLPSWMGLLHFFRVPFWLFFFCIPDGPFQVVVFCPGHTLWGSVRAALSLLRNPIIRKLQRLNLTINLCLANTGSGRAQHPFKIHACDNWNCSFLCGRTLGKMLENEEYFFF